MKKNDNSTNSPDFDRDREFTVVLERIHSDISTIVDDVRDLKNRVNFMNEEFGRQKEDIFIIKTDIRVLKSDVGVLKSDMKDVKGMLGSHENRLARLESAKA